MTERQIINLIEQTLYYKMKQDENLLDILFMK